MAEKRYAIVGTGSRSQMYINALMNEYREAGKLAALCDLNTKRMEYTNSLIKKRNAVKLLPAYTHTQFDRMIREEKIDTVIVTTIDRTHHQYIIKAFMLGCDVITEKPMTIDAEKCRKILTAKEETGRDLKVALNYRYAPRNCKIKELLQEDCIGKVTSVHFEWLLDTVHGADYFRRWHRDKKNSGGLLVHKATHHFDLVNWWMDTIPEEVYAYGDLVFYGRINAESRGVTCFYDRGTDRKKAKGDPFALNLNEEKLKGLYLDAEEEDGYHRDLSVFGDGISIEDDMSVIVKYRNKAVMTYHITAYSPWEGFRIAFNGTEGRLEFEVHDSSYISGSTRKGIFINKDGSEEEALSARHTLTLFPRWKRPQEIDCGSVIMEGHAGGDDNMLRELFLPGSVDDPFGRAAGALDGAYSILPGIAANISLKTHRPVRIRNLLYD